MKMKNILRKLSALPLILTLLLSCSVRGPNLLCENLFCDYTAKICYTIKNGDGDIISGTANVKRDDGITLELISPDIFGGITIKSEENSPQTLSFSYYGIDAKLPQGSLSKINLLLSFFSDVIPSRLSSPGGFTERPVAGYTVGEKKIEAAHSADFETDGTEYSIVYDEISGIPYEISASSGSVSVSAVIEHFEANKD